MLPKRLLVVRLIAQHNHSVAQIQEIAGVSRQTVFTYRDKVISDGVKDLLTHLGHHEQRDDDKHDDRRRDLAMHWYDWWCIKSAQEAS